MKIMFGKYSDRNHHGTQKPGEPWNQETVRGWTVRFVHIENFTTRVPGFRFLLYAPSGKCWNFDVIGKVLQSVTKPPLSGCSDTGSRKTG
jgi:hypothetical protein